MRDLDLVGSVAPDPVPVRRDRPPAPFILDRCPFAWPADPGVQHGKARARACAAAARALARSKKPPAGATSSPTLPGSGSGVAVLQRLGCPASRPFGLTPRGLPWQRIRSRFHLADIFMSARRQRGRPGPEVPGAQAKGRLSPTAVRHPRRAMPPGSSRGGHAGDWKAVPELVWMSAPDRRAIGCVGFPALASSAAMNTTTPYSHRGA
jgi:hypothetical protein